MSWWQQAAAERYGVAIAPSILSADAARLGEECAALAAAGADVIHLDVMDGHFAPNLTYGPHLARCVARVSELPIDCHLMVEDPEHYAARFLESGAQSISIHVEVDVDHRAILDQIAKGGACAGLVLNPPTVPDAALRALLPYCGLVLTMSVNPGFSGQSFDPRALAKLETLARWREEDGLDFVLEIDGGIDPETAVRARSAGAQILVSGSTLLSSPDYSATIANLRGES